MAHRSSKLTEPKKIVATDCYRCGGKGIYHVWGTCFRCGGSGVDPTYKDWAYPADWTDEQIAAEEEKREARNARARERHAEKKTEEATAVLNRNKAKYPELAAVMEREDRVPDSFVDDVLYKARKFPLSEAQVSAVVKAVADSDARVAAEEARLANTPPIEEGTFDITAELVSSKWQENQWGGQLKMLVKLDNGQKLWGTMPTSLQDAEVGDTVSFTATVSPSTDDHTFGFFSRPRKGTILED